MLLPCIKCGEKYEEKEIEAYYCPICLEERNRIAKEVDAKMRNRPKKEIKSDFQAFNDVAKTITLPNGHTVSFARASDIM